MRILRMVCENVKRIKAVDISPKTDVIEVAGRNAQGKSSLMDCIAFALGGKELIQERPVREGESGHGARPMEAPWAENIKRQCEAAGVAFFFKQWGGRIDKGGCLIDGGEVKQWPRAA